MMSIGCVVLLTIAVLGHSQLGTASNMPVPSWVSSHSVPENYILQNAATQRALQVASDIQKRARELQQDPDRVCTDYEAASNGRLSCSCQRYDRRDTEISCDFNEETCTADNSTCYKQSVLILVDRDALSYSTKSCTSFSTMEDPLDTCITVRTDTPGQYKNGTLTCDVTMNSEACSSCSPCEAGENITISWECCNVKADMKQTCGWVGTQGATVPQFDAVLPEEAGKCSSSNSNIPIYANFLTIVFIVTMLL
ncbi:predicted protein [Phaeodactylum tricornutum CCAP 1055/1]|uniref:Uncharacterized protein n=1 Tax=Phaeodactylum tricornutum (strain CCAP 1055/1) TaxID=556484 RepID=B7FVY7_PHATC|nr:predicted protein [Phaeodactylum tricornutum CCAP 1055/1]EEC49710.1 predicted protein [Phaeodactylum tricornutum CCAP 1055/1]|eukprot:XP_002179012.1 predicted protein [Phaeodactylum tricornutum CCAP 1055/1]